MTGPAATDANGVLSAVYDQANAALRVSGAGGGASALDDLTDVTITAPATGAALVYNGSAWVDGAIDLADADAVTGILPDANIAATIARDAEVAAAYSPLGHAHAAGDIASGTVATARLGSGVADGTTYLRGDQTWATPAGGSGALNDLTDVDTTGVAAGATIIYNGSSWVDGAIDLADGDARTGTLPVANGGTGATTAADAATALGVGTADSPQFTAVNIGHASDTTITRVSAGNIAVEGNALYRAGGTDVPIADGGTGQSTATAAFDALAPTTSQGDLIYHDGADNVRLAKGTAAQALVMNAGATAPAWTSKRSQVWHADNGTSAVNTTTETSLLNATYAIGADTLAVGDLLVVHAAGKITNTAGSRTTTFQIGPNDANNPTFSTASILNTASPRLWEMDLFIRIEQIGVALTAVQHYGGHVAFTGSTTSNMDQVASNFSYAMNAVGAYATNATITFDFRVTMSANDYTVSCDTFTLAYIPKVV